MICGSWREFKHKALLLSVLTASFQSLCRGCSTVFAVQHSWYAVRRKEEVCLYCRCGIRIAGWHGCHKETTLIVM